MQLKERLVALRTQRHLTRSQLARAVGVGEQTIQHWETGRTRPCPDNWERLETFYGQSLYGTQALTPAKPQPAAVTPIRPAMIEPDIDDFAWQQAQRTRRAIVTARDFAQRALNDANEALAELDAEMKQQTRFSQQFRRHA